MTQYDHYSSPLGGITLSSDGDALTGLWFDGQKHAPAFMLSDDHCQKADVFEETIRWLDVYFSGYIPDFTPRFKMSASPFRQAVWKALLQIPYGHTVTYGEVAAMLSDDPNFSSTSARAVGGAVSHNTILLIVPCHRVVGVGGKLTGYAAGLERKHKLLLLESLHTLHEK